MKTKSKTPDLETLQKRYKKSKKRITQLEAKVEALQEQVRGVDERSLRMSHALRECMKKLGVERPSGPVTRDKTL